MLGVPGQIRTADTRFRKPVLYPSELQGHEIIKNTPPASNNLTYTTVIWII